MRRGGWLYRVLGSDKPSSRGAGRLVFFLFGSVLAFSASADFFGQGQDGDTPIDVQSCFFLSPFTLAENADVTEISAMVDLDGTGDGEVVSLLVLSEALEVLADVQVPVYSGGPTWVWDYTNVSLAPGVYYLGAYGRGVSNTDHVRMYASDRGSFGSLTQDEGCGVPGGWNTPPPVSYVNEGYEASVYVTYTVGSGAGGGGDPMELYPLLFTGFMFFGVVAGLALGWSLG